MSAPRTERADAREAWRTGAAETLRAVGAMCEAMADALDEDDGIMGAIAGEGLANHLPALPKHIRDVFIEHLDDEAARGYRADVAYYAAERSAAGASTADKTPAAPPVREGER